MCYLCVVVDIITYHRLESVNEHEQEQNEERHDQVSF